MLPIEWISIEVDSHCNLRCTMCPIGHGLVKNQGRITVDTVEKIAELAVGYTDKIALAVMGEPLLHPKLVDMVKAIRARDLNCLLWTNGQLMTEEKSKSLLTAGVSKVIFSYEIIDKQLHEITRLRADYDVVMKNLDDFIRLKDEISPGTEVSIWNIVTDTSIPLVFPQRIQEKYQDVELYASYAMDWHGEIDVGESTEKLNVTPSICNQIQRYLSVSWEGDFISCCNDFNHEYPIVNVHEVDSLEQVLNHQRRLNLMKNMEAGTLSGISPCQTCSAPFVDEGVDRIFRKGDELHKSKKASNAAKQIDGEFAVS